MTTANPVPIPLRPIAEPPTERGDELIRALERRHVHYCASCLTEVSARCPVCPACEQV